MMTVSCIFIGLLITCSYHDATSTENVCENFGCSDSCSETSRGPKCSCPEGLVLDYEDRKTCKAPPSKCLKNQFECLDNKDCIPTRWLCDGTQNCNDSSDEANCDTRQCPEGFHRCDNGRCLPGMFVCDGYPPRTPNTCLSGQRYPHCNDGSDEANCSPPPPTCRKKDFMCENGEKCIFGNLRCNCEQQCSDGSDENGCTPHDCPDGGFPRPGDNPSPHPITAPSNGSDELGCDAQNCSVVNEVTSFYPVIPPLNTCLINQFSCADNNACIMKYLRCDCHSQCSHGSDELGCDTHECSEGEHQCGSGQCIPGSYVCDELRDCNDGSDEEKCVPLNCLRNEFECSDGKKCINMRLRCHFGPDCDDGSDEIRCNETVCPVGDHRCGDGFCVPASYVCNGVIDCADRSDEQNCNVRPSSVCLENQFQCSDNETCIMILWRCNNITDCEDSSDESGCEDYVCPEGDRRCDNGICMPGSFFCDGHKDCDDGSDELECDLCENWGCSHNCAYSPTGPQCSCNEGFELDPKDKRTCNEIPLGCYENQFECLDNRLCVRMLWRCDGVGQCYDETDEIGCNETVCSEGFHRCGSGNCVPEALVCDGINQCRDGSDEIDELCVDDPSRSRCRRNEFECVNGRIYGDERHGRCIRMIYRCDGSNDCRTNTDEAGCDERTCYDDEKKCTHGSCIPESLWCDGFKDCDDNSDETMCVRLPRRKVPNRRLGVCNRVPLP